MTFLPAVRTWPPPPFDEFLAWLDQFAKRALDVAASLLLLLALAPLLATIALLVYLEDRGPVLYAQVRIGEGGRPFRMFKFRSMVVDADARRADLETDDLATDGLRFKMRRDPRITRIGRWIRRASIDELPQLWNVLRGEMSLVGPRPAIPSEVEQYDARERRRLNAAPGITCTWQVAGRSELPFDRQVDLDLRYIAERSFWLDLGLLLRTVPAVLSGRGAY